jgi:SAM-dependent methyltransferase
MTKASTNNPLDPSTATRTTLDASWQASRLLHDWMSAPGMPNYVNRLVSDIDLNDGGHWANYAASKFVEPMLARKGVLKSGLSMVSIGCGSGHIEETLIRQFDWPISHFTGLDYDAELRKSAQTRFADMDLDSDFEFFDFNNPTYTDATYDIVFTCHAIHHATDLERFLPYMNGLLKPDGLIIGIDFFGPTRFQVDYEVKKILRELDCLLPPELKRDLRGDDLVVQDIGFDTIADVRNADISESVRSSDLRTLLFSNFDVHEIKPMGGTLLRWLLQYRAGNFDHANHSHRTIASLLAYIEQSMIESRRIQSDDLFFVLGKTDRL